MTSRARVRATEIRIERRQPSLLLKKKNMQLLHALEAPALPTRALRLGDKA
jgi:hypothetical protein